MDLNGGFAAGKIRKPNVCTLGTYIECICILHNMLIDNDVPVLAEFDLPRERDFDTVCRTVDFPIEYRRARELRDGIAKYLLHLPNVDLNEYSVTV
jgi:hypothetical protein